MNLFIFITETQPIFILLKIVQVERSIDSAAPLKCKQNKKKYVKIYFATKKSLSLQPEKTEI
ncbi:MAG TPA: hypothetical protein DEQ30_05820 [Porphyromonadaceae bacterium]|nr:hypothetical protein [Porphyromonadaceae bacterium]